MAKKTKEKAVKPVKEEKSMALTASREVTPQGLIAQAITQGVPVETMAKLMDLQDRWEAKNAKKAFDEAMADFQMACPIIKKTTAVKNREGKALYYYAKIESIIGQVKGVLAEHGFSYQIKTGANANMLFATCIAKHKMGHSEETTFEVPATAGTEIMSGPQKQAASLTFAKRYAFCNAFGIMTGDEDNDAAQTPQAPGKTKAVENKAGEISNEQILESSKAQIAKTNDIKTLQKYSKNIELNAKIPDDVKKELIEMIDGKVMNIKVNEGLV